TYQYVTTKYEKNKHFIDDKRYFCRRRKGIDSRFRGNDNGRTFSAISYNLLDYLYRFVDNI
ncbi:MAG: hypothetical protein KJ706_05940, partial [Candidatus Omnitrophica bacterium]|nr:hypothetical protein [Candidatus Omnitrophota bacterium]